MSDEEADARKPYWSRCSLGKGRWFWVTYADFAAVYDGQPLAYGMAASGDAAESEARIGIVDGFGMSRLFNGQLIWLALRIVDFA